MDYKQLELIAEDFKRDGKVSDYEAFDLAIKVMQYDLIREAFLIDGNGKPGALESISMCLGMTPTPPTKFPLEQIAESIGSIDDQISDLNGILENR